MDNGDYKPQYNPKDLFTITDLKSGKFLDFALETGHSIITDYSRIQKKILVGDDNNISLGSQKEKIRIKTIDGLKKVIKDLISLVYAINDNTKAYMNRKSKGMYSIEIPYSNADREAYITSDESPFITYEYERKEVRRLLTDQIIFDILYEKYKDDSPDLTLNEYCIKHIRYEWPNLVYDPLPGDKRRVIDKKNTLRSKYPGVTPSLFRECLRATLPESSKFTNIKQVDYIPSDTSDIILKRIEEKIRKNNLLQNDCKKFNCRLRECPEICPNECKKHLKEYLTSLIGKLVRKKDAINQAMIKEIEDETEIMNSPASRENALKLGVDPDLYIKYLGELNKPGERDKKKPKFVWDYLYYNGSHDLIMFCPR